jgi:DNA-binding transcriptional LysR family regulator
VAIESYLQNLRPVQLRLLVKIAELGKLGDAAKACNMTVPGASRILKELEHNLQTALFDRTAFGMSVTKSGAIIVANAKEIVSNVDHFAKTISDFKKGVSGQVKVGAVTGAALSILLPAITELKSKHPQIQISIDIGSSEKLLRGIESGELDFAYMRLRAQDYSKELSFVPVVGENLNFVVGRENRFFKNEIVRLSDLINEMWTIQAEGSPLRASVERMFSKSKLDLPRNLIQTDSVMAILYLLLNSSAVAVITDEVLDLFVSAGMEGSLRALDVGTKVMVPQYYLVMPKNTMLSPATQQLLNILNSDMGN